MVLTSVYATYASILTSDLSKCTFMQSSTITERSVTAFYEIEAVLRISALTLVPSVHYLSPLNFRRDKA